MIKFRMDKALMYTRARARHYMYTGLSDRKSVSTLNHTEVQCTKTDLKMVKPGLRETWIYVHSKLIDLG